MTRALIITCQLFEAMIVRDVNPHESDLSNNGNNNNKERKRLKSNKLTFGINMPNFCKFVVGVVTFKSSHTYDQS